VPSPFTDDLVLAPLSDQYFAGNGTALSSSNWGSGAVGKRQKAAMFPSRPFVVF
jgi:hypothetical protein